MKILWSKIGLVGVLALAACEAPTDPIRYRDSLLALKPTIVVSSSPSVALSDELIAFTSAEDSVEGDCRMILSPTVTSRTKLNFGAVTVRVDGKVYFGSPQPNVGLPIWRGGELVEVSTGGGDLAPIAVGLRAPMPIQFPDPLANGPIGRNQDFVMTWSGGNGNRAVGFHLSSVNGAELLCAVPVSAGKLVVPAVLLQRWPHGASMFTVDSGDGDDTQPVTVRVIDFLLTGTATL